MTEDQESVDTPHRHNEMTNILNSTHKGMLSPNTKNILGYWRILEVEESLDFDRIQD